MENKYAHRIFEKYPISNFMKIWRWEPSCSVLT